MNGGILQLCLMMLGALLMVCSAISDLRWREISNGLNAFIALLAIPFWVVSGWPLWPDVAIVAGIAFAIFVVFALMFMVNAMGGGDVKNVFAVFLWVPLPLAMPSLMVMALAGAAVSGAMLIWLIVKRPETKPEVPYGVAIAAAGLWALHQQYLNQFQSIASS
ncbi:prepilin peptidase [Sphingopyxis sp. PET50]|uniref:A24 family peptidase n=1 Tax=Sphingopyxis sp. PET50 TaxID=2976533 RepID=UPI0021AFFBC6|nr:prepilin peptidase [Sphingopyxis sp. PET50]